MNTIIIVDQTRYAERQIESRLKARQFAAASTVELVLVINSRSPAPATAVVDGREYFASMMQYEGWRRLHELARMLDGKLAAVELSLIDSRMPASLAGVLYAFRGDAGELIAGVHSLLGFKRRLIELLFRLLITIKGRRVSRTPTRDPGEGPSLPRARAA